MWSLRYNDESLTNEYLGFDYAKCVALYNSGNIYELRIIPNGESSYSYSYSYAFDRVRVIDTRHGPCFVILMIGAAYIFTHDLTKWFSDNMTYMRRHDVNTLRQSILIYADECLQ